MNWVNHPEGLFRKTPPCWSSRSPESTRGHGLEPEDPARLGVLARPRPDRQARRSTSPKDSDDSSLPLPNPCHPLNSAPGPKPSSSRPANIGEGTPSSGAPPAAVLSGVNDEPTADWNLEAGLDALDALGWKHVALRAADRTHVDDMDDAAYARVVETVRRRGFAVTSYLSNLGKVPLDADEAVWRNEADRARRVMDPTRQAGTRLVRVMGYRRGGIAGMDLIPESARRLGFLAGLASEAGLVLVIETIFHDWESVSGSAHGLRRVIESVGSPALKVAFDPGNIVGWGGEPATMLDALAPHIADVHVKDCPGYGRRQDGYGLAGDGVCDYPRLFAELAAFGYQGPVTIEPHLRHHDAFHVSGVEPYLAAGRRTEQLVRAAGFQVITSPT